MVAIILLVLLGLIILMIVACLVYVFSAQRRLVSLDELANNALSQIAVQLQSRWDAVGALVKLTHQYSDHEYKTLSDTISQRRPIDSGHATAQAINSDMDSFGSVMGRLMVVAEQYPQLKADAVYRETMNSIKSYEENVRVSRMVYNDSATKMNRMIRQWPSSFVASMFHFGLRDYLEATKEAQSGYPDMGK